MIAICECALASGSTFGDWHYASWLQPPATLFYVCLARRTGTPVSVRGCAGACRAVLALKALCWGDRVGDRAHMFAHVVMCTPPRPRPPPRPRTHVALCVRGAHVHTHHELTHQVHTPEHPYTTKITPTHPHPPEHTHMYIHQNTPSRTHTSDSVFWCIHTQNTDPFSASSRGTQHTCLGIYRLN
jgi:hypothetical protein